MGTAKTQALRLFSLAPRLPSDLPFSVRGKPGGTKQYISLPMIASSVLFAGSGLAGEMVH